ncbi:MULTISPECIES: type II toxin-antitoxin system VapC family toxin [unclassified Arcicella]|uniref:type II toxin-antitoxin system VapC family toxin n=1 Tax=unclassified Arcicella TaxID=2644986 RepID=UPI00285B6F30|nr:MULTISPECIES: type II toxin-antitoxin system VapC family toxin [unclassified Arcicella]MDR6563547.1 putative nucleic acid-binding protein [Arcicella sp. BE51]MDR6813341.1 putative nucleic acid-binding protein [Arcicella sp. BE140]MDR6824654.1 putative nucleic acid-binding protein [Arcicella sp. BE139]
MILCDTNIFIEIYRDNVDIIQNVKAIGQHNIAVSDVTCAELLYGARNKKELQIIRKDLNKLIILPIDIDISAMSVQLIEKYALSHKLSLPDALIASTAIIHDIELYTLNLKDFKFLDKVKLLVTE